MGSERHLGGAFGVWGAFMGHLWGLGDAWGLHMGSVGHLRGLWVTVGVNFGVAMGSFRTILGVNLGDRFGIIIRSLLGFLISFGVTFRVSGGHFGIILRSLWDHFWGSV